jgi:hypothetical protein
MADNKSFISFRFQKKNGGAQRFYGPNELEMLMGLCFFALDALISADLGRKGLQIFSHHMVENHLKMKFIKEQQWLFFPKSTLRRRFITGKMRSSSQSLWLSSFNHMGVVPANRRGRASHCLVVIGIYDPRASAFWIGMERYKESSMGSGEGGMRNERK